MKLTKIRAISNFSTIEQVFECPVAALQKYREFSKAGYAVEFETLKSETWEEFRGESLKKLEENLGIN